MAVVAYQLSLVGEPNAMPNNSGKQLDVMQMSQSAQESFFRGVHQHLVNASYPPGRNPQGFLRRLRRFLLRANPSQEELGLLGGVFAEMSRLSGGSASESSEDK